MNWYAILTCIALLIIVETVTLPVMLFLQSLKAVYIAGFSIAGLFFAIGLLVMLVFYLLESTMSSQPNYWTLLDIGILTVIGASPPLVMTWAYGRYLKNRPSGVCGKCGYDLRGNYDAVHCSECGERVFRSQLGKPKVQ